MIPLPFQIEVPVEVDRKETWFAARCAPLDLHALGQTREEAEENLLEAVQHFVMDSFERGTLAQALSERGFRRDGERGAFRVATPERLPSGAVLRKVFVPFFVGDEPEEVEIG